MERQETMRVITLSDLWEIFAHHLIQIVLVAALCVATLLAYSTFLLPPKYSSTSTLYILKQENSNDYVYTQSDFSLALNVVNDCEYMVKSHEVLDSIIRDLDLDMSYKTLSKSITINNPDNTRVLEVTVETKNAEQSKRIVDAVCRVAANKINETMGIDQVNIYAKGTIENKPSNSIGVITYAIVGLIPAITVYTVYLIAFILDDKIKTEEDVEKYLGLSVLGKIPNSNSSKHKNHKYGYYTYTYKQSESHTKGGKKK